MYSYMRNVQEAVVGCAVLVAVGAGSAGCGTDSQLRAGVFEMGSLGGEESEDWTFQGSEGEWVWIEARAEFEGSVELWSPESSGAVFTRDLTDEESQGAVGRAITNFWTEELPVSGVYRLRITANDGGSGSYQVAFGVIRSLERNSVAAGRLGGDRYPSVGVWRFRGEANEQIWLGMESLANRRMSVQIFDPTGELQSVDDWHIMTTKGGWYEVRVTAAGESESGYSIERGVVESVERDAVVDVEIVPGKARTRMWSFEGTAGEEIEVSVDAVPENIGEIQLQNEQGNLASNSDSRVVYTLADSGRHYVGVRSDAVDYTYQLVVRPVRAIMLSLPAQRLARDEEQHVSVFEGKEGQEIAVSARSDEFSPKIEVREVVDVGAADVLGRDDNSERRSNAVTVVTLPNDGRYYVATSSLDQSGGEYDLDIYVTDMALFLNRPTSGELGGDKPAVGVWGFWGERNQEIGIVVTSSEFMPTVSISAPNGGIVELEGGDDFARPGQNVRVAVARLAVTGRHRIRVSGGEGRMVVYRVAASVVRGTLLFSAGRTLSGAGGFRQRFSVEAGRPQTVNIVASSIDFDVSEGLNVAAVDEEVEVRVHRGGRDGTSVMVARNLASGEYEATVSAEGGSAGAFEITAYRGQAAEITDGLHTIVLGSSGRGLWRVCAEAEGMRAEVVRVRPVEDETAEVDVAENEVDVAREWGGISVLSYRGGDGGAGDGGAVNSIFQSSEGWMGTVLWPVFSPEDDRCSIVMVAGRNYGVYEIERRNLETRELREMEQGEGELREENGFMELWYFEVNGEKNAIDISVTADGFRPTVRVWSPEIKLVDTEEVNTEAANMATERVEGMEQGTYWVEVTRSGSSADSEEMTYQVTVTRPVEEEQ